MKTKNSFRRVLVFFIVYGAALMLISCGEAINNANDKSNGASAESVRRSTSTQAFTAAELSKAILSKESLRLANGVEMRPTRISNLERGAQEISLKFQSSTLIKGFTLYVYSSSPIEISYEHPDLLFLAGAQNAPAANELSKELGFKAPYSEMIGGVFNEEATEMGEIIIKTSPGNLLRVYTEIPE